LPQVFFVPQVDVIAIGEAELMFKELVQTLADKCSLKNVPNIVWRDRSGVFIHNDLSKNRVDLSNLPLPRRDLTESYRKDYFFLFDQPDTSIATSRGCPFRCKFCSVHEFYQGSTSQMVPQRVLSEILAVSTDHITFVDDNFFMDYQRENTIANLIRSEGIKKTFSIECRTDSIVRHPELVGKWVDIGLHAVLLGLEGACNKTLKGVNKSLGIETKNQAIKILQDNGVIIWGAFLVDPDWSEDDFKKLRDYVSEKKITHTQFTILTPLPGTELYRNRHHELLTSDYSCFDALHAVLPTRLPREKFYQNFANLYAQSNIEPYYELVQAGKMTIEDCKRGKIILDAMANWERYIDKDPVLAKMQQSGYA
jgi:radical SAM superfamily enzyme YgiQ (UPF0313 family)